jgi:hypothetical protein
MSSAFIWQTTRMILFVGTSESINKEAILKNKAVL